MSRLLSINPGNKDTLDTKTIESRIPGLDGLRAIAILGVIFYHMFPFSVKGGFLGVSLFFVLSGYLNAITFENSWKKGDFNVLSYYKKRIKRIYPPLFIVVFVTIGALKIMAPETISGIRAEVVSIFFGYNNWWQISQNASYFTRITNTSPFTHLWSLSIELQYYLIYPLLFLLYQYIRKSRLKDWAAYFILFMAVLFSLFMPVLYKPYEDTSRVYYGTDTRIFSLLLGAFLGLTQRYRRKNKLSVLQKKRRIIFFRILMIIIFLSFIYMDGMEAITYRGGMFAISLLFCMAIGLTANPQLAIGKRLDSPPFLWLGRRSYEIYLWQYPVIFLFHYFNWNKTVLSSLVQIIIILTLSAWLHYILTLKNYNFGGKSMKQLIKISFLAITVLALFSFCLGGCSLIIAPESKNDTQTALQQELEQNAKELEKDLTQTPDKTDSDEPNKEPAQAPDKIDSEQSEKGFETESDEPSSKVDESLNFITAIGDSVMLGAAPSIKKTFPDSVVDAKESRQVVKAKEIIDNLSSEGKLGNTVIIALGTNGPFSEAKGQELIDELGENRAIYWINVYGSKLQWSDKSNSTIRKLTEENDNVFLIDWESAAAEHPEWLYNDGIHLNKDGQAAYAALILDSIPQE